MWDFQCVAVDTVTLWFCGWRRLGARGLFAMLLLSVISVVEFFWLIMCYFLIHLQVTTIKTVKQFDELVDMGDDTTAWHQRWKLKLINLFHQVQQINQIRLCFYRNNNTLKGADQYKAAICICTKEELTLVKIILCHTDTVQLLMVVMSCHCASIGLEQLPDCFQSRVPPCHLHDDGCLVLHVLQVEF